jgi:hypothetical protein
LGIILAIENLEKHLILEVLIFNIAFWLYIYIYPAEKGDPFCPVGFPFGPTF